jgi:7-carboxy-7-deazaguanine synthase
MKTIPVVEIFGPTLQGEGMLAGQRTIFIRTAYCDGAGDQWCTWCDSMHAVDPKHKSEWKNRTPLEILERLRVYGDYCRNVTISGGNPLIHDLTGLVNILNQYDYTINVETQGTIYRSWLQSVDQITVSPKPPSAGECNLDRLDEFMTSVRSSSAGLPAVCIKVVVDPYLEGDYEFAKMIIKQYETWWCSRYLSVVTYPQLHILLWQHRKEV